MLIKNLTASPYDLPSINGPVRLPAFGQVEGEFTGEYLELLRASLAVEVIAAAKPHRASKKAE